MKEILNEQTKLLEFLEYLINDPVLFAQKIIGMKLLDYQAEILTAVAENSAVAVSSGHGIGKTTILAILILWYLTTKPYSKVVAIAPTEAQITALLWPEVEKWRQKSPLLKRIIAWERSRIYNTAYPNSWFAIYRTPQKPENVQGFHEDNLIFLCDEASGIPDEILEVIDALRTKKNNKIVMMSNPTTTSGFFYEVIKGKREGWKVFFVPVTKAIPDIVSEEYVEHMKKTYGENSAVYKIRVLGIPADASVANLVFKREEVLKAMNREMEPSSPIAIGCDVARSGANKTSICIRAGKKVLGFRTSTTWNTMEAVRAIIQIIEEVREKYRDLAKEGIFVVIDETGVGGGVVDRIMELSRTNRGLSNVKVLPVNFGAGSPEKEFENMGTYLWMKFRELINQVELPNNPELLEQLSTRRYEITSKGRLILEAKKRAEKRDRLSFDLADSLVLSFYPDISGKSKKIIKVFQII